MNKTTITAQLPTASLAGGFLTNPRIISFLVKAGTSLILPVFFLKGSGHTT